MNALVTKSSCWSYEKEYRIFIDPQYCSKIKIENKYLYFAKIPFNCLIRVDLGLYFDHKFIDDIQMLRNNDRFSNIEFFKAELDRNDYKLIYNKFS